MFRLNRILSHVTMIYMRQRCIIHASKCRFARSSDAVEKGLLIPYPSPYNNPLSMPQEKNQDMGKRFIHHLVNPLIRAPTQSPHRVSQPFCYGTKQKKKKKKNCHWVVLDHQNIA